MIKRVALAGVAVSILAGGTIALVPLAVRNRAVGVAPFTLSPIGAFTFVASGVRPKVRVSHELRNGQVRIWVEDNGVGIHPDHYQRIFGVFERLNVRPEVGGTGIGLALAKAAVERMGGRVGVESIPSQGSRFWIDLTRADEVPATSTAVGSRVAPRAV